MKCILNGNTNISWFHHQMNPDIRLIFHKHQNRITHVTMIVNDSEANYYIGLLKRQYQVDSLSLLVSISVPH
jgi:hypothetical protein